MKRPNFTMAVASVTLLGLIAAGAARAQTSEPPQPMTPPSEAPATVAPPAPADAASAPETTATAVVGETHAPAATAPKKAKKKAANSIAVTVMNSRTTKLVALEAGPAGSDRLKKIAGPLEPGKKVAARAPRSKDCLVDLKGTFDDGETMDAAGVDVCSQRLLNLTE
jgi:hypothetical protein